MPTTTAAKKRTRKKKKTKKPIVRMLPKARVAGAIKTMTEPSGTKRFGAGKAIYISAQKDPARVYQYFDEIAGLLDSSSKIMRWEALRTLGALSAVDNERKLDAHLRKYLAFIRGDNMISAANAVEGATTIALARPDLRERIINAILTVEKTDYETTECRNVVIGQVLEAVQELGIAVCKRPKVSAFIKRQTSNTRASVAKFAKQLVASMA